MSLFSFLFISLLSSKEIQAQTETLTTGSFIINMGATNPNTIANGIKPYGLIYDLIRNYNVPVKWVISQTKLKDGVDFIYNNVQYKGGTFIIPAEYRSTDVNNRITFWTGQGVVGTTTVSPLTVDVSYTLKSFPKWTLDAQNGAIAEGYLINAGITNTAFPGAYNWKSPQTLDCCDDFFVMPHADPTWATHSNLLAWNQNCLGSIWAACHAVSALENMVNPANRNQQTNFLTVKDPAFTGVSGNYANSNTLKLWTTHAGGSVPYIHRLPNLPVSQYLGTTDAAQLNGSEQIYMPRQGALSRWNPGATIIAYDPSQADVASVNPDLRNVAALMVYGRGFDDPNRGYVMYEAAHSHNKGTAGDVAAQRAFFNFSFFQITPKAPQLTVSGISINQQVTNGNLLNLSVTATSPLTGISFSYQWTSTCGGVFSNPTSASTTFNPPVTPGTCAVTCKVTDNCGRTSIQSFPITVLGPPAPPVANNDVAAISNSCAPGTSVTINVLANDTDPNGASFTFTALNQASATPANAGVWTSLPTGMVTFTPDPNFTGTATIQYTITNSQGTVSSPGTITVNVGSADVNGCFPNSIYAPSEVNFITLANYISDAGTTADPSETSLDDAENIYSNNNTDYVDAGTAFGNNLIMSIGSTSPLRAKDSIVLYWSKNANASTGTISVQIGTSAAGPWTNAQTFSNSTNPSSGIVSTYALPGGTSGITHIRISAGNVSTSANSATQVYLDAVEYDYLTCISKQPQLSNDVTTVLEDAPAIIDVLNNDQDPQGLALTLNQITVLPTKGKVSINTVGTITYVSNTDVAGADNFTYQVCNTQGYCNTATVSITIVDDLCGAGLYKANPPGGSVTKVFQYGFTGTNAATANPISTNFRDSWLNQANTSQANGGATKLEVGKLFSSTQARRGIYHFNISEIPATAVVQSAVFSTTRVGGDNNTQDIYLHQLTNSWVEGQVSWANRSTGPNVAWTTGGGDFNGTIEATATITSAKIAYNWNIGTAVQNWVTTPANNNGLLLKTGEGLSKRHQFATKENTTQTLRPKLTITYVIPEPCASIPNRAPLANPDYAATVNGQSVVITSLANDNDVDAGNTYTITAVSGITAGSATFTPTTITYTANIDVTVPRTERLTYTVTDNNGATDQAYVYITVSNAPPSVNKDLASTNSGTPVSISVTSNDSDPEGGVLTAPVMTLSPKYGTAIVVGNNIQYTPGAGFTGNDTLVYQLCESVAGSCSAAPLCDTALVVITVNNLAPTANPDSKNGLPCQAVKITLVANDSDPENGLLTVTNISALSNPAAGTLVNNNDGSVTFTPATGFLGIVTFTYTVTDNGVTPQTSPPATVTITIAAAVNNPPVAGNDVADPSNMDETIYYSVLDNDSDPDGNDLTNPVITVAPLHGVAIVLPNGLVQYTPNPGYFGTDVLTYQICDIVLNPATCSGAPAMCTTAQLSITVIVPNTVVAINDENSTWVNTPVSGATLRNDFDPQSDNPLGFNGFIIGGIAYTSGNHTVSGYDSNGNPVANAGSLTINPDGTYTFTPALNFTGYINVPYTMQDANLNTAYDTAYLRITVNPLPAVDNSVIANNDENTSYGAPVSGNVLVNDRDPQNNTFTVTTFKYDTDGDGTADGTGTVGTPVIIGGQTTTGLAVSNAGTLVLNADGTYTFTPAPDFHGSIDVPYTICDNGIPVACSTAILHIDVLPDINGPLNDPPVAGDDFSYTTMNTPVNGSFINNDSDPNSNPVSLNGTTIDTGGPHNPIGAPVATVMGGTLQFYSDGTYTYTPPSGYVGPDRVNYTICDVTVVAPQPLCTNAFIHLLVGPASTLPASGLRATASLQGMIATIRWETLSEQNSDHFTLERSLDNTSYAAVGNNIHAAGNSNSRKEYQQDDNITGLAQYAIIYYRVKLVDIDGKIKYSNVVALRLNKSTGITAWPNPFHSSITVNITSVQPATLTIRLTDVAGRTILTKQQQATRGVTQVTISNLDKLSNGVYLLDIGDDMQGNKTVLKFIKEK